MVPPEPAARTVDSKIEVVHISHELAKLVEEGKLHFAWLLYERRRDGISLHPVGQEPRYAGRTNGEVCFVDAAAIWNGARLNVFLVNRSPDAAAPVRVALADREVMAVESAEYVTGPGADAANSFEAPSAVTAGPFPSVRVADGAALLQLPRLSAAALTLGSSEPDLVVHASSGTPKRCW